MKTLFLFVLTISLPMLLSAQDYFSESGMPMNPEQPRDGIYDRDVHQEKPLLPYYHVREADVFWEKRIWREIDLREKMNHVFRYPKAPFINILLGEARAGNITLYSAWNDEFTNPLRPEEVQCLGATIDTIEIYNPETFEPELQVVKNELDPSDIIRYRIKEVWFFDEERSQLDVRILGVAPIIQRYDDAGSVLNSGPMFWAYYPEARYALSRHEAFNPYNDAARMTWDDIFEARMFSSYITKASNISDKRIKDDFSGVNALLEAEKIKQEIFNFEHDLWSY